MRIISILILAVFGVVSAAQFAASGEIQGSAESVKNIATWQKTSKRMAIFDAGSFSAKDEKQNAEICSLMQTANYSAIAMGFGELQFSADYWEKTNKKFNLPLLATNVKSPKKIFEKIRTVQYDRSGEKYAVISIVGENLEEISSDYEIEDPRATLTAILPQIPNEYMIILIAHCEPALADSLINEFPRITFGIQGYKKAGDESFRVVGYKKVLQFGGVNRIAILDKKGDVRWREFFTRAQVHPAISVEIFAMSGCPYSKDAIKDFLPLMSDKNYSIKVSFIGNYDNEAHNLSPGLANGSMEEEKIMLAIQDLFPEKFRDFFLGASAENLGLTPKIYKKWSKKNGDKLLAENYKKSQILGINESPTIIVDNQIVSSSPRNILLILPDCETPNLPVDLVLESSFGKLPLSIDTLFLEETRAKEILSELEIERIPAIITSGGDVWNWGEIPDGYYHQRDFRKNEIVVVADSANIAEIRDFIRNNLQNLQNWYLLTDNEADFWLIWHENRNLVSGNNIFDAKTLLKYYAKVKTENL